MNKIFVLIIFVVVSVNELMAQNDKLNWIGVNASVSTGNMIQYGGPSDGGTGYNGEIGFLVGIGFLRVINNRFDIETGLDYSRNSFGTGYDDPKGQWINTGTEHVDLLTIPINVRVKVIQGFFVTGGVLLDMGINTGYLRTIDHQTGIGLNIKTGRDFKIADKMILCIAPEILVHAVMPFHPEKDQDRLTEFGLRISYKFGF